MARPPSPEKPTAPLPAIVVIMPLVSIFRTREWSLSVTKILPNPSISMAKGTKGELVAGPPSATPPPATVVMSPGAALIGVTTTDNKRVVAIKK